MIRDRLRSFISRDSAPRPMPVSAPVSFARGRYDAAVERLDAFVNNMTNMGDADYDKGSAWTPAQIKWLGQEELRNIWIGSYYARRAIDLVSSDAVVRWHEVQDPSSPLAVSDRRWSDEAARLNMAQVLKLADQYASVYGTGYILPITHDTQDLSKPLDLMNLASVQQFLVLTPRECQAQRYYTQQSPFGVIGTPSEYKITLAGNRALAGRWGDVLIGLKGVHASRVIPIIGLPAEETQRPTLPFGEGISLLQVMWLALARADSIDNAGAILAQEIKQDVIKVPDLASIGTSDTRDAFKLRMLLLKMSKSLLNMIVLADGEEFESRSSAVSGFDELAENARNALVACTGIPEPILFGKSTSGLATAPGTEQEAYIRLVEDRQVQRIHPAAHRMYSMIAAARSGPFNEPFKPFRIVGNPLIREGNKDRTTRRMVLAQMDSLHVGMLHKIDPVAGKSLAMHILKHRYGPHGWQEDIPEWTPPPEAPEPEQPPGMPPVPGTSPNKKEIVEGLPGADLQVNNTGKGKFE